MLFPRTKSYHEEIFLHKSESDDDRISVFKMLKVFDKIKVNECKALLRLFSITRQQQ